MDVNELVNWIFNLPKWFWVIFVIGIVFLSSDKKKWEYEAKFPFEAGKGSGEVEFDCFKKKGSSIEIEFELEPVFQNKAIEIFLNDKLIYTIPNNINIGSRLRINEKFNLIEPSADDLVMVKIDDKEIFEARLRKE